MPNELRNRERICTTLPKELHIALKNYSNKTMIPISKIIESAIIEYIKNRTTTH